MSGPGELTGYPDRLSVAPGETVAFHVSTDAAETSMAIQRAGRNVAAFMSQVSARGRGED